ncbi:ABC transporter permease [Salisediminibacterium halotolerans]|uniref:Glycine betaine/proline transport system permease protein/glycine betaine/proline transport system substrate-binding protein n=1 Tax=Salisediminibacterium halotolerans TaxID=517425 RepID=A0A1H9R5K7_9BACI|nr:ABC transporter permease subunit [Salisediminibacterium haloalkalitolerans]SER68012.1 glycine betaine/proline transport system permease protein/glycine betaine/proline transport system substrate-binding protein [Salisediminibacterium haloalkalitolerans]
MNYFELPLEQWTNDFINEFLLPVFGGFFDGISLVLSWFVDTVTAGLLIIPPELFTILLVALAWKISGRNLAVFALIGFLYIGAVDIWEESMTTLSIVLVSTAVSILFGVPIGILSSLSNAVHQVVRPTLDFMQTLPVFIYLIPAVLLFGLGGVPAVIATTIFAMPPAVRMTNLGIRQVPPDIIEASLAFGSTPKQLLLKVQLPLALPTIMAGVNQTIMLALSMAVVASMIGAPGLGNIVLSGISNVNVGQGLVGGLGIVVMAIILDRLTQGLTKAA